MGKKSEKMREACELYDGPLPEYEINEADTMVLCKACDKYLKLLSGNKKSNSIVSDEPIMIE